jgi:hypothetical protein
VAARTFELWEDKGSLPPLAVARDVQRRLVKLERVLAAAEPIANFTRPAMDDFWRALARLREAVADVRGGYE